MFVAAFAFIGAVVGFYYNRFGLVRAASLALPTCFVLTSIALAGLAFALVSADISLRYVAEEITLNMARAHKATALWSGTAGRWLLFAWLVTGCATLAQSGQGKRTPRNTLVLTAAAMLALMWSAFPAPFERLAFIPLEGMGRAAPFQVPQWNVVAPLFLCGHALLAVATALAVDGEQRPRVARWLLPAWLCLTLALSLGAWTLENFILPGWSMGVKAVGTLCLWLGIGATLLLPPVRQQWWPGKALVRRFVTILFGGGASFAVIGGVGRTVGRYHAVALGPGASTNVSDAFSREWTFDQQGVSRFRVGDTEVLGVTLEGARDERRVLLVTERRQFIDSRAEEAGAPIVRVGRATGFLQDVSAALQRMQPNDLAQLRIGFTPFGALLWTGLALLLAAGGLAWTMAALQRRS